MCRKGNPPALLVGMWIDPAIMVEEYGDSFLKKIKNRASLWSSSLTPGHISGENHGSKGYKMEYFSVIKEWNNGFGAT